MKKRVLAAMSGGVDSSVAAALLQEQGMAVSGVTMKLTAGVCCDIASAMAVCDHLGIPHIVIDAQSDFSNRIVGNFISEYRSGKTPNPCIRCNDLIKFQALLSYARDQGFDYLATGHYARIARQGGGLDCLLQKGADPQKDQSYFLYRLRPEQMRYIFFPLGDMHKTAVRKLAHDLKLPAAERPESQEICFVPGNDYRSFLKEHAPETVQPGNIVTTDGKTVGRHEGVGFFTVGQRRKLGVAAGERLYVVRIESESRRVVLGRKADLERVSFTIQDPVWSSAELPGRGLSASVKIRYRSPSEQARIEPVNDGRIRVFLERPVRGISPGQAAVFYHDDTVVGGGVIES